MKFKLKNLKDTGGIFDLNMGLLAYFRHEHTWRSPRGPIKIAKQARATDIYLESVDGTLFGEINEIPPKLITMRLIRTFEIYDDRKELVGVVREKPKMVGSDWELENLEKTVIALMVGDRNKKEYDIQTSNGQVLARCFRDSSLDEASYRVDVLGGGVDLFLLLGYVLVLDLAKNVWTTRGGLTARTSKKEDQKEHLVKTQLGQTRVDKTQGYEPASNYAKRNLVLSVVQTALLFSLATALLQSGSQFSYIFYAFGFVVLVTAILGVTQIKMKDFNEITVLMGVYAVLSLFTGSVSLMSGVVSLRSESSIIVFGMMIVGFGILANLWSMIGLFDDLVTK